MAILGSFRDQMQRINDSILSTISTNVTTVFIAFTLALVAYVVYQRRFHPLSAFPGPFLASLTDLWQVYQFYTGQQAYHLTELHCKYGPIVRYGPEKLSVTSEDAIRTVYVKNNKNLPKTEYYNSFGQPNRPNLFNTTDIEDHVLRRRHLLKFFSPQAVQSYEPIIDVYIQKLRSRIRDLTYGESPTPFDLKDVFWRFMCDVITDLMYGESWGLLSGSGTHEPVDIHALTLWGAMSGSWTRGEPIIKFLIAFVPFPWAYRVFWQNIGYAINREKKFKARVASIEDGVEVDRKDVLTRLVVEKGGEKSEQMGDPDIAVECYGFMIAGIHPPATTLTLLFHHLLHNPKTVHHATTEIRKLPGLGTNEDAYSNSAIEQNLPYLRNCVKENFRLTPVFTMPLPRRVTQNEGILIDGHTIPKGTTISVCNHAFHHDPRVWPSDHQVFSPSRWEDASPRLSELSKLMMHFGAGNRQCIGKVLATTIIHKAAATLLSEFDFQLADQIEQQKAERGVFHGKLPRMRSEGISDLEGPLMVRASLAK